MKLNLAKCTFRDSSDKFLGFIVSNHGKEANLEKIEPYKRCAHLRTSRKFNVSQTRWRH